MSKRSKTKNEIEEIINVRDRLNDNVLDLSLMNISVVPVEQIKPLKRATVLDLSNNVITVINKDFVSLVQLTKLDLSNNKIRLITDDFGNLVNLRHLDLYSNQIERLPLSFGRLKKLKYLDLKNNRLNPAFSKIIGTCTDQKDCIEAARKAVSFMADIEQQVLEERRKEKEKEQKELEMRQLQEKTTEQSKAMENQNLAKKKRNKTKKPKTDNTVTASNEKDETNTNSSDSETNQIRHEEPTVVKTGSSVCRRFMVFVVFAVIICAAISFLKPELVDEIFDRPYTEIMEEYIK